MTVIILNLEHMKVFTLKRPAKLLTALRVLPSPAFMYMTALRQKSQETMHPEVLFFVLDIIRCIYSGWLLRQRIDYLSRLIFRGHHMAHGTKYKCLGCQIDMTRIKLSIHTDIKLQLT